MNIKFSFLTSSALTFLLLPFQSQLVHAQSAVGSLIQEVVITSTKKKDVENVQDVAGSLNAFGEEQLDALKVRDITSLSFSTPNVMLDDIGTTKGTANFSVRGLGVNSSIPSIDPAVGVFVDGIYYGTNAGVIFDTFDLESVEVLRGPQGVLFGRNVTGGAVILNTADPSFDPVSKFKVAVEGGDKAQAENYYLQASTTGSLIDDVLAGKIAVYHNYDKGWFKNLADNSTFGASDTIIVRPSFKWTPLASTEIIFKYEYGEYNGEGPAAQSHINGRNLSNAGLAASFGAGSFKRDTFDFAIDEVGYNNSTWNNAVLETNIDVAFGDGRITNILGYRDIKGEALSDIDATTSFIFHGETLTEQDQISNELRYNGQFGAVNLTAGIFYFEQDLVYAEARRLLSGAVNLSGGGVLDQTTYGIFINTEFQVTDNLSLNAGVRYSDEEKEAEVASIDVTTQTITGNINSGCSVSVGDCVYNFSNENGDDATFKTDNIAPRVGFKYALNDAARIYGHWARSFRAGGYNFRDSSDLSGDDPGPFDDERVDTFELGIKSEPTDRSRLNIAIFQTNIKDMQRELNRSDNTSGVAQIIKNTADAEIIGIEVDGQIAVLDNLLLLAAVGYLDGEYEKVFEDINFDNVIDSTDLALEIPRLAELTYNLGFVYDLVLGSRTANLNVNYAYRDDSKYTDDNLGFLDENERLDASITVNMNDNIDISLYGKNLLNEVLHGSDTQLPDTLSGFPLGGTFAPLNKGQVIGLELIGRFD